MALFRNERDFHDTLDTAAGRLGLDGAVVEKDYWVTQALRCLAGRHAAEFFFKGGTSLSKGFGLIERMSEDIDLLIVPLQGESIQERRARLRRFAQDVAADLDLGSPTGQSFAGGKARRDTLEYPGRVPTTEGPLHEQRILLECGMHEGAFPVKTVTVESLLTTRAGLLAAEFDDLQPFNVMALHPARTLVEKVTLVHTATVQLERGDRVDLSRVGRHFYDIYCLLSDEAVVQQLENRNEFNRMASQAFDISNDRYRGAEQRPAGGFADSPAFVGCGSTASLRTSYEDAEALFYGDAYPSWDAVLALVASRAAVL
jgi:hypothetical protein